MIIAEHKRRLAREIERTEIAVSLTWDDETATKRAPTKEAPTERAPTECGHCRRRLDPVANPLGRVECTGAKLTRCAHCIEPIVVGYATTFRRYALEAGPLQPPKKTATPG